MAAGSPARPEEARLEMHPERIGARPARSPAPSATGRPDDRGQARQPMRVRTWSSGTRNQRRAPRRSRLEVGALVRVAPDHEGAGSVARLAHALARDPRSCTASRIVGREGDRRATRPSGCGRDRGEIRQTAASTRHPAGEVDGPVEAGGDLLDHRVDVDRQETAVAERAAAPLSVSCTAPCWPSGTRETKLAQRDRSRFSWMASRSGAYRGPPGAAEGKAVGVHLEADVPGAHQLAVELERRGERGMCTVTVSVVDHQRVPGVGPRKRPLASRAQQRREAAAAERAIRRARLPPRTCREVASAGRSYRKRAREPRGEQHRSGWR